MLRASGRRRRPRLATRACLVTAGIVATAAVGAPIAAAAPPGRAYEMVSPVDKNDNDVTDATVQAAPSGDAVAYGASGFPGAPANVLIGYDVARRGADWSSTSVTPRQGSTTGNLAAPIAGMSADLSKSLVLSTAALAPGGIAGNGNVYVRDNLTGEYTFVATSSDQFFPFGFFAAWSPLDGASDDFSHVVFTTGYSLLPEAPGSFASNVYEFADGELRLVGILPDRTVNPDGARGGSGNQYPDDPHIISADGSRIFFELGDFVDRPLYMRENGDRTIPISVSQRVGDPPDPRDARFGGASADGRFVFFTSFSLLTDASTASNSLYRYDVDTGALTDLTAGIGSVGGVYNVSADARYVWFTATSSIGGQGQDGQPNLYVWHDGTIRHAATLDTSRGPAEFSGPGWTSVSDDGSVFAFSSMSELAGAHATSDRCPADSFIGNADGACRSVYVYDYASDELRCASCNAYGSAPLGQSALGGALSTIGDYRPRSVLDDGRVYIETPNRLAPSDVNGRVDVYEWNDGTQTLISTGQSPNESEFGDATPDGRDVFFKTTESLVAQDVDHNVDLYDARAGGGIASQNVVSAPQAPCQGDDCRARPSAPPSWTDPTSSSYRGRGDVQQRRPATLSVARVSKAQLAQLARGGRLALRVRVDRGGKVSVAAKIRIRGRHVITVARGATIARRAGVVTVEIRLAQPTRRALARQHGTSLSLWVAHSRMRGAKVLKVKLP